MYEMHKDRGSSHIVSILCVFILLHSCCVYLIDLSHFKYIRLLIVSIICCYNNLCGDFNSGTLMHF